MLAFICNINSSVLWSPEAFPASSPPPELTSFPTLKWGFKFHTDEKADLSEPVANIHFNLRQSLSLHNQNDRSFEPLRLFLSQKLWASEPRHGIISLSLSMSSLYHKIFWVLSLSPLRHSEWILLPHSVTAMVVSTILFTLSWLSVCLCICLCLCFCICLCRCVIATRFRCHIARQPCWFLQSHSHTADMGGTKSDGRLIAFKQDKSFIFPKEKRKANTPINCNPPAGKRGKKV